MKVGDILKREPYLFLKSGMERVGLQECRVVYIHPRGRFYTVEFTSFLGRRFRQCYPMTEREKG